MQLTARGQSTRRIAAALAVSGQTVEWHVANILASAASGRGSRSRSGPSAAARTRRA